MPPPLARVPTKRQRACDASGAPIATTIRGLSGKPTMAAFDLE